jgi:hypothetical protein
MKIWALTILTTLSLSAGAFAQTSSSSACSATPFQITTVLLHSAHELNDLVTNGMDLGGPVTCTDVEPGVIEYVFKFASCGNCMPKNAIMTVLEDTRPSQTDGPVEYTHTITIK